MSGRRRRIEVTFEDRRLAAVQPWREMDAWEAGVLRKHLDVDFEGAAELRDLEVWPRVRTMDECGCLEFERATPDPEPHRIVTDGYGPDHPDGSPFQSMLTLAANGELLWLEFHQFGGPHSHRPTPESLTLFRSANRSRRRSAAAGSLRADALEHHQRPRLT